MPRTIGNFLEQVPELNGIQFDIISSRIITLSQLLTEHPVEDGSITSDFTIKAPISISITAEVGNLTLSDPNLEAGENAQRVYAEMEGFFRDIIQFSYQTGFQLYENMIITNLAYTDTTTAPGALFVDLTIRQLEIKKSEQVKIPQETLRAGKTRQQLASKINAGKQAITPVEDFKISLTTL